MKTPMLNWEADSCYYQRGGTLRVDAASFFLGRINLAWVVPNSFQPQKGKSIETTAPLAKLQLPPCQPIQADQIHPLKTETASQYNVWCRMFDVLYHNHIQDLSSYEKYLTILVFSFHFSKSFRLIACNLFANFLARKSHLLVKDKKCLRFFNVKMRTPFFKYYRLFMSCSVYQSNSLDDSKKDEKIRVNCVYFSINLTITK